MIAPWTVCRGDDATDPNHRCERLFEGGPYAVARVQPGHKGDWYALVWRPGVFGRPFHVTESFGTREAAQVEADNLIAALEEHVVTLEMIREACKSIDTAAAFRKNAFFFDVVVGVDRGNAPAFAKTYIVSRGGLQEGPETLPETLPPALPGLCDWMSSIDVKDLA